MSKPSKRWIAHQLERVDRVKDSLPKHAQKYPEAYNAYLDACASLVRSLADSKYDTAITCMARAWSAGQDSVDEEKRHAD